MGRYDLTDFEWSIIQPLLPNKPRGVPRVDDRREGEKFTSAILPRYARRAPSIDAMIQRCISKGSPPRKPPSNPT